MRTRYYTFEEFLKHITIVSRAHKGIHGVMIVCKLKRYVLIKTEFPLWNSKFTRRSYLAKLYIAEVLRKKNVSLKIARIPGYELLGRRCTRRGDTLIICGHWDVVDTDTGELDTQLLVQNTTNKFRGDLYYILKSEVQL